MQQQSTVCTYTPIKWSYKIEVSNKVASVEFNTVRYALVSVQYLWSAGSADHLEHVSFTVFLTRPSNIMHCGLDHHQVSWQVDTHCQSTGGNWYHKYFKPLNIMEFVQQNKSILQKYVGIY